MKSAVRPANYAELPRELQDAWYRENVELKVHGSNELVTEDQAAIDFARLHAGHLRFCHDSGIWYEWDGSIWRPNRTGIAFHWARELVRELGAREPDKVRYVTSKVSFSSAVERASRSDPALATTSEEWDRDPMLLGTPGGTVNLRTGALRPPNPTDYITKSVAVAPADTADCPLWQRFLNEAAGGDAELVRFLQQWCGYSLTGDVTEQALVFVHGPGGTGKSVFINVMTAIMDAYAATPTMEALTVSKGERHTTDIAMLRGARMATASETEHGRPWAESRIKQLTGADSVTARFMRQDNFTFKPIFKLLVVGNAKPRLRNADDAMYRRFNIVPFVHKPEHPDRHLEEKLKGEWPAILRWAIDGCLAWQNNGLARPAAVRTATGKYFADQDLWTQWLEEECDAEPGNRWKMAGSGELFQSWSAYAKAASVEAGTRVDFAEKLEAQGFEPDRGTGGRRIWRGICLRSMNDENRNQSP
jgi:putative DNA primase/helicase